ncbi:c-type cytochrome [Rhizobium sp. P38BS-XIX]|uniref:c-type cytochrome n=1 Tax=Rhizobium sp. P38BS-XIX TaxID=2726740 RepID=UPI0014569AB5|nr:cytochrome c [Rhizobium sp. P38BS-XIX]NLR98262.1 c-type cytochrome [Rhizobium sp. P38BS-XIX]
MRKFLLVVLLIIVLVAGGVAWFVTRKPASAFDNVTETQAPSEQLLQRGEYVARLSDCVACHSTPKSAPFAGGLEMGTPLGSIFTTNITPDKETGIGNYTLADFDRAVRHGVARDGHRLYPAMPYPSYVKMSDDDIQALYAYFTKRVDPVRQADRPSDIKWPMNMRWPLALWNAVFTEPGRYQPKTAGDELWNRGAYLVQGPGHCGSCHTPRSITMAEKALDESSPLYLSGALLDGWYAPSLRSDPNTGLGRWSEEDIYTFLKTGRNQHGVVFGSMADAFNNSTQFMTDDDLKAISHYLKALPGDPARDGTPWQYVEAASDTGSSAAHQQNPGAQTFLAKCSFCHGVDGRGKAPWISPLAGATSSLAVENASQINVTLNGSSRVVASGIPDAYRMPPFRQQLSDQQIADVLTLVRSSWGNHGGAVAPGDVKTLREHTDPASSRPIVLQMR